MLELNGYLATRQIARRQSCKLYWQFTKRKEWFSIGFQEKSLPLHFLLRPSIQSRTKEKKLLIVQNGGFLFELRAVRAAAQPIMQCERAWPKLRSDFSVNSRLIQKECPSEESV